MARKSAHRRPTVPVPAPPSNGLVPAGRTLAGTETVPLEVFHVPEVHPKGPGPWAAEPDKVSWIDPATGLPCIMRRGWLGALCGYVGVGPDHPMFGIAADALPHDPGILVHGGVTYANACDESAAPSVSVCHVPAPRHPPLDAGFGAADRRPEVALPHELWWFGFACDQPYDFVPVRDAGHPRHTETGRTYRDERYVVAETTSLAAQLHAVAEGLPMPARRDDRPPVGLGSYDIGSGR